MPKELDLSGRAIGGYRVKKMLGAGGMGAVALARQVSLDRDVALKILPVQFAKHPELLARFTREALSAAQLTHHNIVQVHDVGCEGDIHFFSMEFVRGQTLSDMVRKQGRLSPEEAASLILQAARGLKYAHDRGLVHRDIKPDNILVDEHGIVKIADMGLAKFRQDVEQTLGSSSATTADVLAAARGDITMANIAMGTPAYMSPEQAKDASSVDHRADQYSLGCTLYYLIAGAAPYGGSTAREIITKHQQDPLLPLDKRVRNIPPALNAVVSRMLEKRPEDRYADMAELIRNLEFVLGVHSQQAYYTPREQELQQLEDQLNGYYFGCPSARRRQMAVRLFFLSTITALLGADLTGQFALAGGFFGLLVMAPVFNFIFDGIAHKTYVFRRLKSTLSGMRLKSTTLLLLVVAALGALLHYCGFLVHWGVFAAVAVALAAFYQFRMVRGLHRERAGVLNKARNMLKHLRLKGTPEEHIRDFVCRFSGDDWEEFFEDLFGYQAMIEARNKWVLTDATAQRRRYAPWRDALVRWCDKIETKRRTLRDKRHLAKVEAKRLRAQGASALDAKRKAEAAASQILADIKIANRIAQGETETIAAAPRPVLPRRSIFSLAFSFLRFVLGVFICAMFLSHWFGQMLPPALKPYLDRLSALPIPPEILKVLHGYFAPAVGGALIVSSLSSRFLAGLLVVIGAALMLAINYLLPMILGRHHLITETAYIHASLGFMIGGILLALISRLFTGRF